MEHIGTLFISAYGLLILFVTFKIVRNGYKSRRDFDAEDEARARDEYERFNKDNV